MELQLVTYVDRPDLDDRWADTVGPAWPEFLTHDSLRLQKGLICASEVRTAT